jgi:hypothetical protein
MTADRQTAAWAKRYQQLLDGFIDALGGEENITPTRRAMAKTLATLQAESSALSDRFAANGSGGSPDDINLFLRISGTIESLLGSVGLSQSLQQPPVDHDRADDAREALMVAFDKIIAARQQEEANGVFHNRDGVVLDNTGHVEGCACEPCRWRRSVSDEEADAAAAWRKQFGHTTAQPTGQPRREPVVVNKVPPQPPALTIVAGTDAIKPDRVLDASSSPEPPGGLEERRHQLVRKRDELQRERNRLSEEVLTNPTLHAQLSETIAKQAALASELREIDIAIAKAAPDSSQTHSDWVASGGGSGLVVDWSPSASWRGF